MARKTNAKSSSRSTSRATASRARTRVPTTPSEKTTTKLTPDITAQIAEAVQRGAWLASAAESFGVPRDTVKDWMKLGAGFTRDEHRRWKRTSEVGPEPYGAFYRAICQARGAADTTDMQRVSSAGKNDWRASAWRLERRSPVLFGARLQMRVVGPLVQKKVTESMDAFLDELEANVSPECFTEVIVFLAKKAGITEGQQ